MPVDFGATVKRGPRIGEGRKPSWSDKVNGFSDPKSSLEVRMPVAQLGDETGSNFFLKGSYLRRRSRLLEIEQP